MRRAVLHERFGAGARHRDKKSCIVVLQITTAGLLGAIVGAVIGAVVSNWLQNGSSTIASYSAISLRRIGGHRHVLTPKAIEKGVPTEPLSCSAKRSFRGVPQGARMYCAILVMMLAAKDPTQHIGPLIRAMVKASRTRLPSDDEFVKIPFG